MAKIASCFNCIYAYYDGEHALALWNLSVGVLTWPACANHPDSPGRMQRVPPRGICRNYRPRPAKPEGDVKQIPLGGDSYAYVDAADFDWLNQWTWCLISGYAARREKGKVIYLHRALMQPPKGKIVDHLNRNKLDDTRANLRNCSGTENARNREKHRGASSRFKGVSFNKQSGKWLAIIKFRHQPIYLGSFTVEVEAARAYDRAAVQYFGEFAHLNFPDEWPPQRRAQVYAEAEPQRRRVSARRRPAGQRGRKATAGRKPCAAGRKKAVTRGTERSRSKRAAKNAKIPSAAPARNQNLFSRQGAKGAKKTRR